MHWCFGNKQSCKITANQNANKQELNFMEQVYLKDSTQPLRLKKCLFHFIFKYLSA